MTEEQLGKIRREFGLGLGSLIGRIVVGVGMIGLGFGLLFMPYKFLIQSGGHLPLIDHGEGSWAAVGFVVVIWFGLTVGGLLVIRHARSLLWFRVRIGQNGFSVIEKKRTRVFGWDEIESVEEIHRYEGELLQKPRMVGKRFVVNLKQGETFAFGDTPLFGSHTISTHTKLAHTIKKETDGRNIPWEIEKEDVIS